MSIRSSGRAAVSVSYNCLPAIALLGITQLTGLALELTRSPQHFKWTVCTAPCALLVRQVGRLNPAELKAQKLARSGVGGGGDRNAKPDVDERRAIYAVLNYPPNRSCSSPSA